MKNHELLDMIGDVNEDYVLEAGNNVVRPRFGWKKLAACAACAALVLGVSYPAYMATHPALHDYTVMEGGSIATLDDMKAPAGEIDVPGQGDPGNTGGDRSGAGQEDVYAPDPNALPGGAYVGPDSAEEPDPTPVLDCSVDEAAADQYDLLLRGMGMHGEGAAAYPEWFAGAWIDHGGGPDDPVWLTVAIVDGFHTPEREAEITGWCGDGVVFRDAKYSHGFLDSLMEPVTDLLDGTGLNCGIGVDVIANCLGVDLYSDGQTIPDSILAQLAKLDPDGDAIRVRLYTGRIDTLTDEIKKGPAPDSGEPAPVRDGDASVYHGADAPADAAPGGARPAEDLPQSKGEECQTAHYDLLPLDE